MWPTDKIRELNESVTPEKFPLTSALLVSEEAKIIFLNFSVFCKSGFLSVAKDLEEVLRERENGARKVVRPNAVVFGITPLKCMALYSQAPATTFQRLFLQAKRSGVSSEEGLFWEW